MNATFERKATAHKTSCHFCLKQINKGEFRLTIRSYGYHAEESLYAHPKCIINWMEGEAIRIHSVEDKFKKLIQVNPSRRDE